MTIPTRGMVRAAEWDRNRVTGRAMRVKGAGMKTKLKTAEMTWDQYRALGRDNWSSLKTLTKSPAHYRHAKEHGRADTATLRKGRASHVATLEPAKFGLTYAVYPGRRAGKEWEAFRDANSDREILTTPERDAAFAIAAAVRADPHAAELLSEGAAEQTLLWSAEAAFDDEAPPARFDLKGRADFVSVSGRTLVDLKTCRDASQEAFGRAAWDLRYYAQAAFYVDGFEAMTGERWPFSIIAVESSAPHVVQAYRVPDMLLEIGRAEYRALLSQLALCRHRDEWPGYSSEVLDLTPPRWSGIAIEEEGIDGLDLDFGADAAHGD